MVEDRVRSFIAVDLDDAGVKQRIAKAQQDLERTGANLKIVHPDIMHLTLRFLGEIPQPTVPRVANALASIRFQTFQADFSGVGVFPNLRRISVIWVGIKRGQEKLIEIFQALEPKLRQMGLPPDDKGFSPHLTIARVRSGANRDALAKCIEDMRETGFGEITVNAVRLKKSTLTPRGPIYTTIHETTASP